MKNWFKKKKKKNNVNDSIKKNRDTITLLEKREALIEKKIQAELVKAKKYIKAGKKPQARQCMVRKKTYEKQKNSIVAQMTNLENINMKLEEAQIQKDVFQATKTGASDLKKIQKSMGGIDNIEEDLDNIREVMQDHDELSEALGQGVGAGIDDADIMDELDELEQESLDSELAGLDDVSLPSEKISGGETKVKPKPKEEDGMADFDDLEAELNG